MSTTSPDSVRSADELEAELRQIGATRYHILHPFHRLLHGGQLNRGQVQAWALNRYYYQSRIPAKDATLLARLPTAELRRAWRSRIEDHDGTAPGTGGVARWLQLATGVGLDRDYVESTNGLLPGTRFAVDAYVNFVRERSILEAIASSLTELFSPTIISERVSGMLLDVSEREITIAGRLREPGREIGQGVRGHEIVVAQHAGYALGNDRRGEQLGQGRCDRLQNAALAHKIHIGVDREPRSWQ